MVLSPDEVLSTLVLVIPGFVALAIARYSWGTSRQLETFPLTVWSIFLSGFIDFVFLATSGIPLPPTAEEVVKALSTWRGLAWYGIITLGIGILGGLLLRFEAGRVLRKIVWLNAPSHLTPTLVWDDALSLHLYQSIVVGLEDKILIQGFLERFSTFDEPREILLARPRQVVYAVKGQAKYFDMGDSIVIPAGRIVSLRFLQPPVLVRTRSLRATFLRLFRKMGGGQQPSR